MPPCCVMALRAAKSCWFWRTATKSASASHSVLLPLPWLRDGKTQPRPAEFINSITDMMSINPVDFLLAAKKDRVRVLLEAIPLALDVDRLKAIAGEDVSVPDGMHPLYAIDAVRKSVFEHRTDVNRSEKEKSATINQLRDTMPEAPDVSITGSEDELVAQVEVARWSGFSGGR